MGVRRGRAPAAFFTMAFIAAATGCNSSNTMPAPTPSSANKIKHVIVMLQENRSFDNLFAGYPGADTATEGPCVVTSSVPGCKPGKPVPLKPITLETTGTPGGKDIQHDHAAFELEYDHGKMDGFNLITLGTAGGGGPAGLYPYAYVERSETTPYWNVAKAYTLADKMFSTATTDSFVAHQQIIAGTTRVNDHESLVDTPSALPWGCDAPTGTTTFVITTSGKVEPNGPFPCMTQYKTMADVLDAAGVSWKYYVATEAADFSGNVWNGFDAIAKVRCARFTPPENCTGFGPDWRPHIISPQTTVLTDIKNGTLPQVSWVIPSLADSDHPASGSNTGPSWVTSVINSVGQSQYWNDTAIVILWDDWGGFYDNVAPPQVDYTSIGMRVPMLIVSPYARHAYIAHTQYDIGSILKFIEQTFNTGSLGTTDASANSIVDSFDFTQTLPKFTPFAAPYPREFFLRPRPGTPAREVIEADGWVPE